MYKRSLLRYAHITGFTSLIYTLDGEFILTCGSDGDIRKWRSIDDDDPSSNCLGEYVVCLAQKEERLLASTDHNTVQAYTFPDMDRDGTLMRFTAPVVTIKVKNNCVAAGSEDTKIKILSDNKEPMELEGHKGPVLSLDIHPRVMTLASVGGEGALKIWNIRDCKEIKTIHGLPKSNSFENAKYFGTPCFEPCNGDNLAYVSSKEIIVLNTSTWEFDYSLKDDQIKGEYTCCQFSNDGLFLAAGTDLGEISVFDINTRQVKKCEGPSSECQGITCLAWNNKNNYEIAYCDAAGQLGTLFFSGGYFNDINEDKYINVDTVFGEIEFDEDDSHHSYKETNVTQNNIEDDADGENAISIEKLKEKIMSYGNSNVRCDDETRDSAQRVRSVSPSISNLSYNKSIKQQVAFQPSSTPIHLEHRYLVWNSIGIVTMHADGSDGAINVEFHDASMHHSLHIPNYNVHNMASLSSSVLALTSEHSSKVICIALSVSGNKEWSIQLPDCESVEAICVTSKVVAVVSNLQFLRLFTVMGTQREIISIPGPVVCVAGHEDRILVSYHSAPSNETQQNIQGILLQTKGLKVKCENINIPIKPKRQLTWIGFSDFGSPVFYDSMGLVQLFNLKSNCWYPVCDTMKQLSSVSNHYFLISLSERSQIIQAVLCRGTSYPMTTPRPMVQELPLQFPLCDIESEKSTIEDTMLRANMMEIDNAEKTIKETAIKLFALACRGEVEARAEELIATIASKDLLMLSVKYATKIGRIHLSEKLSELLPHIEDKQNAREHDEQFVEQTLPASPLSKPYQNVSITSTKKLAPKFMDLGSSKKNRFRKSYKVNSAISLFQKSGSEQISQTSETSQENCSMADFQTSKMLLKEDDTTIQHSPQTSVNPFASKRKLSQVDKIVLMGSEKLKMIKK